MVMYEMHLFVNENNNHFLVYKSNEPDNYPIYNLKYQVEVNKTGSCSFVISVAHPQYSKVQEMNTFITIVVKYIKDGVVKHTYCPFIGRVLEIKEDQEGNKEVTCEGVLSTLNDTFARTRNIIGAYYPPNKVVYEWDAMVEIFRTHNADHDYVYRADYSGLDSSRTQVLDELGPFLRANVHSNMENISHSFTGGTVISDGSNDDDSYKNDTSMKSLYDMLFSDVLKKAGGFILPIYDPYNGGSSVGKARVFWTYYNPNRTSGYYANYVGLVNYPNENEWDIPFDRTGYIPHFTKGYNVLNLSKESSLKTKFNKIIPVGKDNVTLIGNSEAIASTSLYAINVSNDSPYEDQIPIVINFSDIDNETDLRSAAEAWANVHNRDASIPQKYTITGPEPCGVGCGEMLIMLMRDVVIREDDSEYLINCPMLPCLSMDIDVQNPQNNTYVIGPFIDDTYAETTISSK